MPSGGGACAVCPAGLVWLLPACERGRTSEGLFHLAMPEEGGPRPTEPGGEELSCGGTRVERFAVDGSGRLLAAIADEGRSAFVFSRGASARSFGRIELERRVKPSDPPFVRVAASRVAVVALDKRGRCHAWSPTSGYDLELFGEGEGDGWTAPRSAPGGQGYDDVAMNDFMVVLRDAASHKLRLAHVARGTATTRELYFVDETVRRFQTLGPVASFSLGERHGVAVVAAQDAEGRGGWGPVVCWGADEKGQCGVPEDLGDATQVAAGAHATVALQRGTGQPFCWGGVEGENAGQGDHAEAESPLPACCQVALSGRAAMGIERSTGAIRVWQLLRPSGGAARGNRLELAPHVSLSDFPLRARCCCDGERDSGEQECVEGRLPLTKAAGRERSGAESGTLGVPSSKGWVR